MNRAYLIPEMGSQSIIREAVRADIPQIIALANSLYDYRRDERFFIWQCFDNINPAILVVAEENRQIVGMFGIQKVMTSTGFSGGQISWINIAEHKRGSGLFHRMGHYARSRFPELDFIFIFSNHAAVKACEKSLGMNFIGRLNRLILNDPTCDAPVAGRWEQITADMEMHVPVYHKGYHYFSRDKLYRFWRYAKNPLYQYYNLTTDTGETVIFKLFEQDDPAVPIIGDIVDFECDLSNVIKLKHLFQTMCFHLGQIGAKVITTWAVSGTPLKSVLEEMGFAESNHNSFFGINVLREAASDLYHFDRWHLVQSDATNY
jgi:hypothetical protein